MRLAGTATPPPRSLAGSSRTGVSDPGTIGLSIHDPDGAVDAAGGPTRSARVASSVSHRLERRAMFSKPLANPSTLDRPPPGCASRGRCPTWRGFGARVSCSIRKKRRQKHTHIPSAIPTLRAGGVFLSQAGPRFAPMSSSSWASPRVRIGRAPLERRKATRWVALDWLGMRLET